MSATKELLDRYRETCSIASDNAAAKRLHVTRASTSAWRTGKGQASPATVAQMARAIGEDEAAWLARVESERARSEADRKTWARVWERLRATAAAVAGVAMLAVLIGPGNVQADAGSRLQNTDGLYIMRIARRYLGRLRRTLRDWRRSGGITREPTRWNIRHAAQMAA